MFAFFSSFLFLNSGDVIETSGVDDDDADERYDYGDDGEAEGGELAVVENPEPRAEGIIQGEASEGVQHVSPHFRSGGDCKAFFGAGLAISDLLNDVLEAVHVEVAVEFVAVDGVDHR